MSRKACVIKFRNFYIVETGTSVGCSAFRANVCRFFLIFRNGLDQEECLYFRLDSSGIEFAYSYWREVELHLGDMIICRCEEVSLQTIQSTITEGACTAKEIKLRTRAGMGICQGRTCRPLIDQLVQSVFHSLIPEASLLSCRLPVRPILLSDLATIQPRGDMR